MDFKDYQNCSSKADQYDRLKSEANKCQWMIDKIQKKGRFFKKTEFYTLELTDREGENIPGRYSDLSFDQAELLPLQGMLELKMKTLKAKIEAL